MPDGSCVPKGTKPDGTGCTPEDDDGNACTQPGCRGGACVNDYEIKVCPPSTGDLCNLDMTCDPGSGACVPVDPEPVNCNDFNPCTSDYCDPTVGCLSDPITCPDDGDPCTIDSCSPVSGCGIPDPACGGKCVGPASQQECADDRVFMRGEDGSTACCMPDRTYPLILRLSCNRSIADEDDLLVYKYQHHKSAVMNCECFEYCYWDRKDHNGVQQGCFDPSTRITLADGSSRPIMELQAGDMLLNPLTGKAAPLKVLVGSGEQLPMVEVEIGGSRVKVTQTHPFLTTAGLKQARELTIGDRLYLDGRNIVEVSSLIQLPVVSDQFVVNVELDIDSNDPVDYMIIANGIPSADLTIQRELEADRRAAER